MAYNKPSQDQPSASSDPDDGEAASDEARGIMRLVNGVMGHAQEIEKLLRLVPPTAAREIAEQKVKEVVMWAGQAFLDSEK
jgi:hypothetical protein